MLLMQRDSKNSRLGPQSVAASYVSNRSEGSKSLASLASMMSEKVTPPPPSHLPTPPFAYSILLCIYALAWQGVAGGGMLYLSLKAPRLSHILII